MKGRDPYVLQKYAVKIAYSAKSAGKSDVCDRLIAFGEHIFCIVDAVLVDIIAKIYAGTVTEYAGKIVGFISKIVSDAV